jgi:hypothetical protein
MNETLTRREQATKTAAARDPSFRDARDAASDRGGGASGPNAPRAISATASDAKVGTPVGSSHHGGWLGDRVLPFLDRRTTHTQRARLPLVAAGWTSLFVLCSLGTFLLGRGEDAQAEACAGTSYRDAGECDDRSDAAPVVSYSGILFPERAVFLVFGVPTAPLWFITILLSHRALVGLVDAACATRLEQTRQTNAALDDDDSSAAAVDGPNDADALNASPGPAVYAWPLRRMEPLALLATPLLLLVVCVSLGDPQPGPAIHAISAFFFFLLAVYNVFLTLRGANIAAAVADDVIVDDDVALERTQETEDISRLNASGATSTSSWTPSAFFLKAQTFKKTTLFALFGAMVPVTAFWAAMTYRWGGEEHMLAPVQYLWILAMTLGNGACVGEIRSGRRFGERRVSRGKTRRPRTGPSS